MKLIACLAIIALSAYIGRLMAKRAALRLEFVRQYEQAMITVTDRIAKLNVELYRALDVSACPALCGFFRDCSRSLRECPQRRFADVWGARIEKERFDFLTAEDMRLIRSGGEALENLCANPSEKQAQAYIKRLAAHAETVETEKRKKSRLYNTGGVLAGMFAALLII